ncbi:uncharacterized protein F5147DRAFT_722908 [Suillus discolor]|uniref:Ubiquitin 3 binding protein But2 C-terminal domain-containing protein n=1 Tax=Suillus discolor TaxID=1912936 RepID=A0A9P7EUG0_9AGAM|nr:uncharacterized protein F5147DRAFT_722908 [Suillus discolor]KAG2091826.1 hypothetical protein F5147DRAFT_722908 [Suillus discolor]
MLKNSDLGDLPQRTKHNRTLSTWLLAITILCTVLDFSMIFWDRFLRVDLRSASTSDELELLPFQNSYLNLEILYKDPDFKSSTHDPIINNVPAIAQVSNKERQKIIPSFQRYKSVEQASAPIYEQRLIVTHDLESIAQFRVLDFGMENCSLSLTIPPRNSTEDFLYTDLGDSVILDVWSLPARHKLDLYNLSWSKLPQPRVHIGHMNVSYGKTSRMPSFQCKSQSYQTFAVSCSNPGCLVNVTGNDIGPSGLYMYQSQTI